MNMTDIEITKLLTAGYNRETWKGFLRNLFPLSTFWSNPHSLNDLTSPYVSAALRLGDVKLDEGGIERSIGLFEVVLDAKVILERNRVGLRNLLKKYWRDMDGAFIVYTQPSSGLWRFTYVSELTGFDSSGEYQEIKTDPKRYTYVFGDGESCRTAVERFQTLLAKGKKATIADIIEAFSVEKLSKSFFDNYKKQYELFCEYLILKPGIFKTNFNGEEKAVRDFVKLFLGRITFLYFIQKKGWLGVPLSGNWGEGDKQFLSNVFNRSKHKSIFYQDVLTKLFFDTLNTPRENDLVELPEGQSVRIPFLNGGLFEEENPKYRNLVFEENLFKKLFDFFNQYNFTIYEDDPNDHTVAVDPEMLGHIFENLLEDNKDKGAFYTPKEIVHYMSQESLIEYLTVWFENKGYEVLGHTSIKDTDESLFANPNDYNFGQLEIEIPIFNQSKKIDRSVIEKLLKKSLDDSDKSLIAQYIDEFNKALDSVKICDPAIGSGAFPMGLLQEIYSAKQTLWHFKYGSLDGFPASEIKLNIIQNSIYGVDIEKGAVDIARLRFWLSLVVDETEPKPLPNLDYKIMVGDSLISKLNDFIIEIDGISIKSQYEIFENELHEKKLILIDKLCKVQNLFFTSGVGKKVLAHDIRDLKINLLINHLQILIATQGLSDCPKPHDRDFVQLYALYLRTQVWLKIISDLQALLLQQDKPLVFFDWKLDFPEIFNEKLTATPGFDIVIGNPPYGAKFSSEDKLHLSKHYSHKDSENESYVIFLQLGSKLLKINASLWYIIPNNILTNTRYSNIRNFILNSFDLRLILDLGAAVFESASVDTCIFSVKNRKHRTSHAKCAFTHSRSMNDIMFKFIDQSFFETTPDNIFNFYIDPLTQQVISKILANSSTCLSDFIKISRGIEYGYNSSIVYDHPSTSRKPLIAGRCISRYQLIFENKFVEVDFSDTSNFKTMDIYESPKIFVRRIGTEIKACYDGDCYYNVCDVYNLQPTGSNVDLFEVLGLLNSKLINFFVKNYFKNAKVLFPKIPIKYLNDIPIKFSEGRISYLAKEIHSGKKLGLSTTDLEKEIDIVTYRLYGLTQEDVKIIDPDFNTNLFQDNDTIMNDENY